MLDGWVKYVWSDDFAFKVGQFKAPINRQFMTAAGKQQFINRSAASQYFTATVVEREIGVEASGGFSENKFQWAGAFVNGNGRNADNGDTKFQYIGRVAYNLAGDYGYSEGDLEGGDTAAATLGAAVSYHDFPGKAAQTSFNIDGGWKRRAPPRASFTGTRTPCGRHRFSTPRLHPGRLVLKLVRARSSVAAPVAGQGQRQQQVAGFNLLLVSTHPLEADSITTTLTYGRSKAARTGFAQLGDVLNRIRGRGGSFDGPPRLAILPRVGLSSKGRTHRFRC